MKDRVYLAAGGTGGHINAALSMGEFFSSKYEITYFSGTRYLDYKLFKDKNVIHLDSKPLRTKNPLRLFINISKNILIFSKLFFKFLVNRPRFVVGAGGYVCGPTLLAAWMIGVPIFIVEQNAVMGVTNKLLSKISKKIFVNFKETKGLENKTNVIESGNPISSKIKFFDQDIEENTIKILVFGGSLGALQINDAIELLLKKTPSKKIIIKHQVGKDKVKKIELINDNIEYEQLEYIDDMENAYKWANLIIARAGASTISELRVVRKPTILIPYPAATDNHQFYNAQLLQQESDFPIEIIDHKLYKEDLADKVWDAINSIIIEKKIEKNYPGHEAEKTNSIILKEIENVWNK